MSDRSAEISASAGAGQEDGTASQLGRGHIEEGSFFQSWAAVALLFAVLVGVAALLITFARARYPAGGHATKKAGAGAPHAAPEQVSRSRLGLSTWRSVLGNGGTGSRRLGAGFLAKAWAFRIPREAASLRKPPHAQAPSASSESED